MKSASYKPFAARTISTYLKNIKQNWRGAYRGNNTAALHQIRVFSRRLRNALWIFKDVIPKNQLTRWNQDIRKLSKASGEIRDCDVQLEFLENFKKKFKNPLEQSAVDRLARRFVVQRARRQKNLIRALDSVQRARTLSAVTKFLGELKRQEMPDDKRLIYTRARKRIRRRIKKVLRYQSYADKPQNTVQLHQLRIANKHLRYTLETFAKIYGRPIKRFLKPVLTIHYSLGDLHDYDVWIAILSGHMRQNPHDKMYKGVLNRLYRFCIQKRKETYQKFFRVWQKCKEENFWDKLVIFLKSHESE